MSCYFNVTPTRNNTLLVVSLRVPTGIVDYVLSMVVSKSGSVINGLYISGSMTGMEYRIHTLACLRLMNLLPDEYDKCLQRIGREIISTGKSWY